MHLVSLIERAIVVGPGWREADGPQAGDITA
jgi:hypothetical protein